MNNDLQRDALLEALKESFDRIDRLEEKRIMSGQGRDFCGSQINTICIEAIALIESTNKSEETSVAGVDVKPVCFGIFASDGEMFFGEQCISEDSDLEDELELLLDEDGQSERGWQIKPLYMAPPKPAPEQQWFPIESAPKDGSLVFAWHREWGRPDWVRWILNPRTETEFWNDADELDAYELENDPPTHWMPLPPSPSQPKEGG